jgi:DNA-binding MarR family transcriptional regulator
VVTSRDLPADRLAVGQLLVRLLHEFRAELSAPAAERGYADVRRPHLHIFGNVGVDGVRLTELAERAQLSLATASELVSDLQRLGYLERRPDPRDRRAKLVFPTRRGRELLADAGDRVAAIERRWAEIVGDDQFAAMCETMQHLLDALTDPPPEGG